tara:strand:- start:475 stop:750 length:276 start_codon:yes stop_codon:yes gene_type:complete
MSVCSKVEKLSDDHYLSLKKVNEWIKHTRNEMKGCRRDDPIRYANLQAYIREMNHYLQHGDWISDVYGMNGDRKINWKTIRPAYDSEGYAK